MAKRYYFFPGLKSELVDRLFQHLATLGETTGPPRKDDPTDNSGGYLSNDTDASLSLSLSSSQKSQ